MGGVLVKNHQVDTVLFRIQCCKKPSSNSSQLIFCWAAFEFSSFFSSVVFKKQLAVSPQCKNRFCNSAFCSTVTVKTVRQVKRASTTETT